MNTYRWPGLIGLALLSAAIWWRASLGTKEATDVFPLLVVFPLYYWLGRPWCWSDQPRFDRTKSLIASLVLIFAGLVLDSTLVLTLAWVLLVDIYLGTFTEKYSRRNLLLVLFGFPWVLQEFPALGWFFRYSGAGAADWGFSGLGFQVQREGTMLLVQGLPLSVDVACSGLNVLQAMLVAGSLVICLTVPAGWRFGVAAASLLPLTWLANTLRIFMLGCVGLTFGPDFAMGWFHQWGGLAVLLVMFILCQGFFWLLTLEAPKPA
jgi:exosortase/archaeosortase family protein